MWPLQVDAPFCEPCTSKDLEKGEGRCHSKLTHPFVNNAGLEFREGCGHSKLTDPFVGNAGVNPSLNLEKEVTIPS